MNIRKLLVANRGEIAIRVLRAANEPGIRTVAIYAIEDKLSLHRFKSDQAFRVGAGSGPVKAYLDIADIIRIAKNSQWSQAVSAVPMLKIPARRSPFRTRW